MIEKEVLPLMASRFIPAGIFRRCFLLLLLGCTFGSISCHDPTTFSPGIVYPDMDAYPRWSPDGSRILYVHYGITEVNEEGSASIDPDSSGLWVMTTQGENKHRIIPGIPGLPVCGDWSPDGSSIVFDAGQLFTVSFDGYHIDTSSIRQLTSEASNNFPDWSPDGESIAFCSNMPDPSDGYWICTMLSQTGDGKVVLTPGRYPDWSPDGLSIVFVALHYEIYRYDLSDSTVTQLTELNQGDLPYSFNKYPKCSPDGTKIAFDAPWGAGSAVYVMDADGSDIRRLVDGGQPSWSPDGRKIAFTSDEAGTINDKGTVWVVNVDGSGLRQLTHGPR
jgi:Tol biopolymer transport system component